MSPNFCERFVPQLSTSHYAVSPIVQAVSEKTKELLQYCTPCAYARPKVDRIVVTVQCLGEQEMIRLGGEYGNVQ